jgi:two-component system chemotaxis response regulator CheB
MTAPQRPASLSCTADLPFEVVAIAASAGGVVALRQLLAELPCDFPVPVVVVQHRAADPSSRLADVLGFHTALRVKDAQDGEPLRAGTVYLGPPDRHVMVRPDHTLHLDDSSRVHFVRPAADLLFRSLAASFGKRVLAVVLTGWGSDAARGARAIKYAGGRVLAQDEATSERFEMPSATIATGCVDFVLPLSRIASALVTLVMVRGAASFFTVPVPHWVHLAD